MTDYAPIGFEDMYKQTFKQDVNKAPPPPTRFDDIEEQLSNTAYNNYNQNTGQGDYAQQDYSSQPTQNGIPPEQYQQQVPQHQEQPPQQQQQQSPQQVAAAAPPPSSQQRQPPQQGIPPPGEKAKHSPDGAAAPPPGKQQPLTKGPPQMVNDADLGTGFLQELPNEFKELSHSIFSAVGPENIRLNRNLHHHIDSFRRATLKAAQADRRSMLKTIHSLRSELDENRKDVSDVVGILAPVISSYIGYTPPEAVAKSDKSQLKLLITQMEQKRNERERARANAPSNQGRRPGQQAVNGGPAPAAKRAPAPAVQQDEGAAAESAPGAIADEIRRTRTHRPEYMS